MTSRDRKPGLLLPRRRLLQLGAGAGLAAWAAPWQRGALAATPPAKPTGQIVAGISQEPTVFNPLMVHIEVDEGVYWNLYSPLWGVDPKGNFIPQLAKEVPTVENGLISADGLTWTIKLREGVKWHDGAPFTADDVKYSIELLNNPNFRAGKRQGHELVKKIEVKSPTELVWHMEKLYAPYPSILAWTFIVPKHIMEKADDPNTSSLNTDPIGTGPFKWKERVAGDHITLAANPDFFGEGPYAETLIFKYIPDLTVLYTQFQTGDIDYIGLQGITADHYEEAKKLADRTVTPVPAAFIENIAFNLGKPQFQDLAVRQALYYATDKQSVIDGVYYGLPKPSESYLPRQVLGLQPRSAEARVQPRQGQGDAGQGGLEGGCRRRAREGRRPALLHQLDHGRQPSPRAGPAAPPAELAGRRRQDGDPQPARRRHVGRLLDDVEVRHGHGRHRLHGRARIPTPPTISAASRSTPSTAAARTPPSSRMPRSTSSWPRGRPPSTAPSVPPPTSRCRWSRATSCPSCRSSSTPGSRGRRRTSWATRRTSTCSRTPGTRATGTGPAEHGRPPRLSRPGEPRRPNLLEHARPPPCCAIFSPV